MKKYLAAFLLLSFLSALPSAARAAEKETTYDRVIRTKTLRCGYLPYEPFVIKDPNTGNLSGMTVDYVTAIATRLGLKVEWSEGNIDQFVAALDAGKFDAICIPMSPDEVWEKVSEFTGGLGAMPYYIYVPEKSTLTQEQLATAKFVTVDGYTLTDVTRLKFPKAQYLGLPQTTATADAYNQLKYGKGDAHVNENISALNYMKGNPGAVRRLSDKPLVSLKFYLLTQKGDAKMKAFVGKNFDAGAPENKDLFKSLRDKYGITDDSLLPGDRCKTNIIVETDGRHWPVCADE